MTSLSIETLGAVTDVHRGLTWSAGDLRDEIARRRAVLAAAGVAPGQRVIIAHGGTPAFFGDLFAIWSLGAAAVCLNPTLTRGELANVADFVEPAAVLVSSDTASPPTDGLAWRVLEAGREPPPAAEPPAIAFPKDDDPALILFTSGTTGDPKGVVHTAASLSARLSLNRDHIEAEALARVLCVLPTHFGHGLIGNCLTPLLAGGHLHLFPSPGPQGTAQLGSVLAEHAISFMSSVPAFWKLALKVARPPAAPVLRRVHIGSAPLAAALWQAVMDWSGTRRVCNLYGITETANWVAGACGDALAPEDGLIGTMWGGEAAIAGPDGLLKPEGEGELLLRTPSIMAGYFRRPDLTDAVLQDGWYRTGDWGRIDAAGTIRLVGRTKTEINRAGMKILPEEIDLLLERHPAVAECCTFAMPDPVHGESVAVALRCGEEPVDAATLRDWCAERIRRECVPERWFFVTDIPKTDRGKINRARVRDFCLSQVKAAPSGAAPQQSAGPAPSGGGRWKPGQPLNLETARFRLRSLTRADATDAYVAWWNDAEVQRGLGQSPRNWTKAEAVRHIAQFDNRQRFHLGIFVKEGGRLIGFYTILLNSQKVAKTNIVIGDKDYWGQGVVTEIREQLLHVLFRNFNMHKVRGEINGRNYPSIYNYKQQGFTCEGIRREEFVGPDGTYCDIYLFGLLRAEWESRQAGGEDGNAAAARLIEARRLLADAFGLPLAAVPEDATLGRPKAWDSLGHMRVLLALEERLGKILDPAVVSALASLEDVAAVLATGTLPPHRLTSW